jgi:hypothetical protein
VKPLTSVAEPKIFLSAPALALAADSFIGYLDSYRTFFDLINSIKIVTIYKKFFSVPLISLCSTCQREKV